jgi:hypothetical protein
VRVEGVPLEDHGHVAILGGDAAHGAAREADLAFIRVIEPGHEAQGRRFAAARGADEHDKFSAICGQIEPIEDHSPPVEAPRHPVEDDLAHDPFPPKAWLMVHRD